jgi:hypothetical protein
MSIARRIVSLLTLCVLMVWAWYSVLLARADGSYRDNNLTALRNAVRLVPANAAYHAILAEHLEAAGANPDDELEIATDLSPYESRYWIRRGFRAELEQNFPESERYLLRAFQVDRGFDPRWALMNYYFRRGRLPQFWKSTREALDISYGNLSPIFRLCLAASDDPAVIRQALPPRHDILSAFFAYLTAHGNVESASSIAQELASTAQPDDVRVLVDYCGQELVHHNGGSSLTVWNAMCDRRLIPFSKLSPAIGQIVTNGDFSAVPLQMAYDWKYGTEAGIAVSPMDTAPGVSIDVSGKQRDSVTLISQEIPLIPGKQYTINYDYRLVGGQGDSGLHWAIRTARPDAGANPDARDESIANSSVLIGQDWNNGSLTFASGQRDSASLVLEYRRTLGTIRWNGTAQIRRVASSLSSSGSGK